MLRPNFPRVSVLTALSFSWKAKQSSRCSPSCCSLWSVIVMKKNKKRERWEENRVVSHAAVWLRAHPQREVFASCMLYIRRGNLLLTYTWHPVSISVRAWNPGHETGYYVSLWCCCVPVTLNIQWQGCGLLLTLATFKKDIRKTSAAFFCISTAINSNDLELFFHFHSNSTCFDCNYLNKRNSCCLLLLSGSRLMRLLLCAIAVQCIQSTPKNSPQQNAPPW